MHSVLSTRHDALSGPLGRREHAEAVPKGAARAGAKLHHVAGIHLVKALIGSQGCVATLVERAICCEKLLERVPDFLDVATLNRKRLAKSP